MPHLTRRGFSLVELLIAMTLLGIVTLGLYRALMTNQRVYQQQTQVIGLQQNMRAAAAILPQELRELDATGGDVYAMSATSLTVRAHRWTAVMCTPPVTGVGGLVGPQQINGATMIIRAAPYFGRQMVLATDSMFIRYEGDDGTRKDDGYIIAKPTLTAAAVCPSDGKPGTLVTMNLDFRGNVNFPTSVVNGDPVQGFEVVTYSLYQPTAGGDYYVGLTTVANGQLPLIGPLLTNGLSLSYYDSTGAVTAVPTRLARVDITLRGQTAQLIRARSGSNGLVRMVDSVVTSVAMRNNRRY